MRFRLGEIAERLYQQERLVSYQQNFPSVGDDGYGYFPSMNESGPDSTLTRLVTFARKLIESKNHAELENTLSVTVRELLGADYSSFRLRVNSPVTTVTSRRSGTARAAHDVRTTDRILAGWVIKEGMDLFTPDLSSDARFPHLHRQPEAEATALAREISDNGESVGVLIVLRPRARPFLEADRTLLGLIAEITAPMVGRLRRELAIWLENEKLRETLNQDEALSALIGRSSAWEDVRSRIRTIGPAETRVLLLGESGTGKELCARAIHRLSARHDRRLVSVNCAAITEQIAESEFFGHVRGSFTGATQDSDGLFGAADGGTLFLDEIGSTPFSVQSLLLRAIQEGEVRPVGSHQTRKVNVRLICSTSADLESMVASNSFRKDLYYRINVVTISLPSLRSRREDIAPLAHSFLEVISKAHQRNITRIDPDALSVLELYHWPGNVRELQNAIEHAVLFSLPGSQTITSAALPEAIRVATGLASASLPVLADSGLDHFLESIESRIVMNTLEQCGGNQSAAARVLKIPEKRVRDRMKRYGIGREDESAE